MKENFSIRNGYSATPPILLDDLSSSCKNRLWNKFYDLLPDYDVECFSLANIINSILDCIGEEKLSAPTSWNNGMKKIKVYWDKTWHNAIDVLEYFLSYAYSNASDLENDGKYYSSQFNSVLEEEHSGYRFLNGMAVAVSNEMELSSLKEAINSDYTSVNIAITKAINFYSVSPADYENAIKEAISAIEAMCNCITGNSQTLGQALKELDNHGCKIHSSISEGFKKLYGYASDAGGIRHGKKEFCAASEEDAKYMIITCSAFINYLKVKLAKSDITSKGR